MHEFGNLRRIEQDRRRPPRRRRASAGRSRAWCRRRCRASGHRGAGMRLSASSHLAIAIFCWLPPEKAPTRVHRARSATSTRSEDSAHGLGLARRRSARSRRSGSITGNRDIVLAVELEEQRLGLAVLRHQADADLGAHRIASARSSPPAGRRRGACRRRLRAMPKQARNRSSWPMPCRPATPRISPACSSKLTSRALAGRQAGRR